MMELDKEMPITRDKAVYWSKGRTHGIELMVGIYRRLFRDNPSMPIEDREWLSKTERFLCALETYRRNL